MPLSYHMTIATTRGAERSGQNNSEHNKNRWSFSELHQIFKIQVVTWQQNRQCFRLNTVHKLPTIPYSSASVLLSCCKQRNGLYWTFIRELLFRGKFLSQNIMATVILSATTGGGRGRGLTCAFSETLHAISYIPFIHGQDWVVSLWFDSEDRNTIPQSRTHGLETLLSLGLPATLCGIDNRISDFIKHDIN